MTKVEHNTTLDDEVSVLTVPQTLLTCAPQTETTDLYLTQGHESTCIPSIPEVCRMADITDCEKAEVQTLP